MTGFVIFNLRVDLEWLALQTMLVALSTVVIELPESQSQKNSCDYNARIVFSKSSLALH